MEAYLMNYRRQIVTVTVMIVSLVLLAGNWGAAWSEESDGTQKNRNALKCDRTQFRMVVDVGHTEETHGAMSARNVPEYDFNFRLAKEIAQKLIDDGFTKTHLLITHGAKMASLYQRVASANRMQADLYLSIHHDSVPDSFLERWDYEGVPSHYSDRFSGHSLFVSEESSNFRASLLFGRLLGKQLKDRKLKYTPHYTQAFMGRYRHELLDPETGVYRYDGLEVLRRTQMPAVLLEAGSIINRDEEMQLNSPEHRAMISAAVTAAVETYCDARMARPEIAHQGITATAARAAAPAEWPASLLDFFKR
jgi:N-acetylmuramoyl-L-alanine amidase